MASPPPPPRKENRGTSGDFGGKTENDPAGEGKLMLQTLCAAAVDTA